MRVGIVGSRRRKDKHKVIELVDSLEPDTVIVSGGCRGVDTWAVERAKERGLKTEIYKPDLGKHLGRFDIINKYYERNKKIAQNSDIMYAFVAPDRRGGTENTIKWAKKFGVEVVTK